MSYFCKILDKNCNWHFCILGRRTSTSGLPVRCHRVLDGSAATVAGRRAAGVAAEDVARAESVATEALSRAGAAAAEAAAREAAREAAATRDFSPREDE